MNRIIIIGNGFDLAHNLKTGYKDFINDYWATVEEGIYDKYWRLLDQQYGGDKHSLNDYEDQFIKIKKEYDKTGVNKVCSSYKEGSPLWKLYTLINEHNNDPSTNATVHLNFENHFFERISNQCSPENWVDIENEYYNALKKLSLEENAQERSQKVKKLNIEFEAIKNLLEKYLYEISKSSVTQHASIIESVNSLIELNDVALKKQQQYLDSILKDIDQSGNEMEVFGRVMAEPDPFCSTAEAYRMHLKNELESDHFKKKYCIPTQIVFLNFNYTNTAQKLYLDEENDNEIINIHGELYNKANPMIFGYGDELDNTYKKIEELQDNDFLENIKSINYHETRNYRRLLEFIESGIYQVFIMGHSCGNSDRTLLNTLFEHDNCASIKVYYWQQENGSDNYSDLIRNISRNFNDKPKMRDIVVNRENCSPLVPTEKEVAE
ncbi:AbiH family protein [Bacteroides thetaiotaomicron]|jgi:DNA-binding ferritin-like protein (Dps family)|uniref:AbiH family protein n=1 Tax=Bacteroides thetaiotaomicron TaxID=818 RepID=UPI0022E29029|nr:AbiH family protein [Bacteroides thetaiotaomicron]